MKQVIIYIHAIYEFLFTYIEIYEFLIFDYVDMHPSVLYYSKSSIISNNSKSIQFPPFRFDL